MLFKLLADADAEAREGHDEAPDAADPDAAVPEQPSRGRRRQAKSTAALLADSKCNEDSESLVGRATGEKSRRSQQVSEEDEDIGAVAEDGSDTMLTPAMGTIPTMMTRRRKQGATSGTAMATMP